MLKSCHDYKLKTIILFFNFFSDDLIGPCGLQLFVDAGLPISSELIYELIRDVIAERIKVLLGHPKPLKTPQAEVSTLIYYWHATKIVQDDL